MKASAGPSRVLAAVRAFYAERGYLPRSSNEWDEARHADPRYPCWPTIRRAGFRHMEEVADALGLTTDGSLWGRTRVIAALRLFASEHGALPGGTDQYHRIVKGDRRYPSFYAVLKWFGSFEAAAQAAAVPCRNQDADWTREEEDFLRAFAGTCTRLELTEALGRHSENAVKRRLYDLGLTCRTAQGLWTRYRLCKGLGITDFVVDRLVGLGVLTERRVSRFIYFDPAELPDWLIPSASEELRGAVLHRRRMQLRDLLNQRAEAMR